MIRPPSSKTARQLCTRAQPVRPGADAVRVLISVDAETYTPFHWFRRAIFGHRRAVAAASWTCAARWCAQIYDHSCRIGRQQDWADPEWHMLNEGGYGSGARWYLDIAVEHNDLELAHWCLTHGADPMVRDPNGMTAADRAERNAMLDVARLLSA